MSDRSLSGLFVCEGTSDQPLADIVEYLFVERDVTLRLSRPDFSVIEQVGRDVESKLLTGGRLMGKPIDVAVVHRDADSAGRDSRCDEIQRAVQASEIGCNFVPIIPVKMTEAWLLLDEREIRIVAGNPNGRDDISLPKASEVERLADPKHLLKTALSRAASARGRRRDTVERRFPQHRRQLLERLDLHGPVTVLSSWQALVQDIDEFINNLS